MVESKSMLFEDDTVLTFMVVLTSVVVSVTVDNLLFDFSFASDVVVASVVKGLFDLTFSEKEESVLGIPDDNSVAYGSVVTEASEY